MLIYLGGTMSMENSSDAATLARVKKLKQDLADAEDDLNTTKQDHKTLFVREIRIV